MKIIFMGTPDFAVGTLEALISAGHEICLVVTQPDKPKGRGKQMQEPPVKSVANRYQIPVFQPQRIREAAAWERLASYQADIIVVIAFGQILPKEILTLTPYGCVNVHASLLPAYRGAAPIQWSILSGDKITGITTMQMDEGLDTGDMLLKAEVSITAQETGVTLHDKLAAVGAKLCVETLTALAVGEITPIPQGESTTPYAKMLTKEMGKIDWQQSAKTIDCLIRGMNSWPGAYTYWGEKLLKIWQASPLSDDFIDDKGNDLETAEQRAERVANSNKGLLPGTIVMIDKKYFIVQTGDGLLCIEELQASGKKRMDAGSFLRGNDLLLGDRLI